jgi:uncharacterized protein YukE
VTVGVKSSANWTGSAAEGYSAFTGRLAQGVGGTVSHLNQIASAVRAYAGSLRTAQEKVTAYNKAAEAASCLIPTKQPAAFAALAGIRTQAVTAVMDAAIAGDVAAAEVKGSEDGLILSASEPFGPPLGTSGPTIQSDYLQQQVQLLDEQTRPAPPLGPEAEAAPPGWQQRAAALARFREWLGGSNLPPDPHAEGASGTGYENPYTDLNGDPVVGDVPDDGGY